MPYPRQFSDIYGEVISNLRLDAVADLAATKNAVNQAYSEAALTSKFFEGSAATSALVANASSDAIPTAIIELEDVTCTATGIVPRLVEVSFEQILDMRMFNVNVGGPPQFYSVRKASVEFWPSATGGEILTYYGSKQPDTFLSADSDVPLFPEPFSALLVYGACCTMAEFKTDILMLGNYQQQKQAWTAQFLKFCEARKGSDSLAFPVRLGRRGYLPNDPSSDWYTMTGTAYR